MHQRSNQRVVFETERLIVRHFTADDHDNYFALHGDPVVMQYIRPAKTREECYAFLNEFVLGAAPHPFMGRWVVNEKCSGKFVGSFVIIPIPDDKEKIQLGYSLVPEFWGKGFATELTKEGLHYFRTQTPLEEIYAVTESPNTASKNVLLKAGFQPAGNRKEGEKELLLFMVKRNS